MAGYSWKRGMSNNAVAAYQEGMMPLSKWNKTKILERILFIINNNPDIEFKVSLDKLKRKRKDELFNLLIPIEWHHTSSHFNKTEFYDINIEYLKNLDNDASELNIKYTKEVEKPYPVIIKVMNWGGTKKHPTRLKDSTHCGILYKSFVYSPEQKFLANANRVIEIEEYETIESLLEKNPKFKDKESFLKEELNKRL